MQKKQIKAALLKREVLKQTWSVCPVCLERIAAERVAYGKNIYLEKTCPEHGFFKTLVWQVKPYYQEWLRQENNTEPSHNETAALKGCPYDCGICPEHKQEACCVLIELTQRCNQACKYCFADAGSQMPEMSLAELDSLFDFLMQKNKQDPFFLQLSGGEPTMREDLLEIIALAKSKGFPYLQLNTNGKRLAESEAYAQSLAKTGLNIVFLQFDGTDDEIYRAIRNEALFETKKKAIANCRKAGLGVVLVVTAVPKINTDNIGSIIDFMLANLPAVRGIHFQPVSYFGRFPKAPQDDERFTIPQLLSAIEEQSGSRLKAADFLPLLSGHCLCSFHGNFVQMEDGSITSIAAPKAAGCCSCKQDAIVQARNYIAQKWSQSQKLKASARGADYDFTDWDSFIKRININGFSITAMAFQDCWNLDLERLQKCRVYVATPAHRLIPFCAYNLTDTEGRNLYGRYT
ncbi:MAG: radical SAM protein [Clostridia bacterium]|nr:radical SAM protein [Clostridia bacterium]